MGRAQTGTGKQRLLIAIINRFNTKAKTIDGHLQSSSRMLVYAHKRISSEQIFKLMCKLVLQYGLPLKDCYLIIMVGDRLSFKKAGDIMSRCWYIVIATLDAIEAILKANVVENCLIFNSASRISVFRMKPDECLISFFMADLLRILSYLTNQSTKLVLTANLYSEGIRSNLASDTWYIWRLNSSIEWLLVVSNNSERRQTINQENVDYVV